MPPRFAPVAAVDSPVVVADGLEASRVFIRAFGRIKAPGACRSLDRGEAARRSSDLPQ